MAGRVWLHVGCPKTGTSFLQSVLWANRDVLRRQGLLLPRTRAHHWRASLYVRGAHRERPHPWVFALDWQDLVAAVRRARGDVLISNELFAPATPAQASRVIEALGGDETHVLITTRDLARQIPACWQQSVKHGSPHRFDEFVHDVVHRGPRARTFWRMQDVPAVASRWGRSLPPERVHLVTVPPAGCDPGELWRRFASVPGIDPGSVDLRTARRNESLGRVEVELMRRVNAARRDAPTGNANSRWFKDMLADGVLRSRPGKQPFAVHEDVHPWVVETARETVETLQRQGYDVVGDLADLVPPERPVPVGPPAAAGEQELLQAAAETIVELMDRHRAGGWRDGGLRRASGYLGRGLRWMTRAQGVPSRSRGGPPGAP